MVNEGLSDGFNKVDRCFESIHLQDVVIFLRYQCLS